MKSYKQAFSHTLGIDPGRLHCAAHSHHPWPDVTRDAHMSAWDLAARGLDHKWATIFEEVLPRVGKRVARVLRLPDPGTLVFAPNTHELIVRLFSSLPTDRVVHVLSSGSEFHSFTRQARRWVEAGRIVWEQVDTRPFATFPERFAAAANRRTWDVVHTSHVMFDSSWFFEEAPQILSKLPEPTLAVLDGYHGFMAIDTDLSLCSKRVFYVSGGYKYAMSGEGACFMHAPPGIVERPVDTGWFAGFAALERSDGSVGYGKDGSRFFGATFDPSGVLRLDAVLGWLEREGLDTQAIHARVTELSELFLDAVAAGRAGELALEQLLPERGTRRRGNFLCFARADAVEFCHRLAQVGVIVDARGDRLRFGFGLYHDREDIERLVATLAKLARP